MIVAGVLALVLSAPGWCPKGRIRVVDNAYAADLKVRRVTAGADLRVELVDAGRGSFRCGQWALVDSFPDYTIAWVRHDADIKVVFVDDHPGWVR